jgi:putative transposase
MWKPISQHRKSVKHYDNGEPHFLTFSCYNRLPLLTKDRTREWFAEALDEARRTHGFHLWGWVVMPEHVHLLIWPPAVRIDPDPASNRGKMSGILADVKRPVAQKAVQYLEQQASPFLERLTVRNRNRTYRRFWQAGPGYDENIADSRSLYDVIEYIHFNPVRRGLVTRAEDWIWSSVHDWLGRSHSLRCTVDRTLPTTLDIPR